MDVPIRPLIESGFSADKRSDVSLYYGARNLQRMAYQDRFKAWESEGVRIIPVLSHPIDSWAGESGCVHAAFARAKQVHFTLKSLPNYSIYNGLKFELIGETSEVKSATEMHQRKAEMTKHSDAFVALPNKELEGR